MRGRSPRDAALRESLQAIHLRTLEEETAAEAERLASMLVGIDAEYATVEAEAVRAGVVKARRAVSPSRPATAPLPGPTRAGTCTSSAACRRGT